MYHRMPSVMKTSTLAVSHCLVSFCPVLPLLLYGTTASISSACVLSSGPSLALSRGYLFFWVPGAAGVGSEPPCVLAVFVPLGRDPVFYADRVGHASFRRLWGGRFQGIYLYLYYILMAYPLI